jgi:pectin methylesterase-like acyl-CoA thioesterase
MRKLLHKPVSLAASLAGGAIAGVLFKHMWKLASGEDAAPKATQESRGWREILVAAAQQGAVFATVKAAVDRGAAEGTRKLTGTWPGERHEPERQPQGGTP